MAWLWLMVSVAFEVLADVSMKLTNGFENKKWIAGMLVGYAGSFYALSQSLFALPLGLAYAIWTSLAIVLMAVAGRIVWREAFNSKKIIGIALVIVGIALLRLGM